MSQPMMPVNPRGQVSLDKLLQAIFKTQGFRLSLLGVLKWIFFPEGLISIIIYITLLIGLDKTLSFGWILVIYSICLFVFGLMRAGPLEYR